MQGIKRWRRRGSLLNEPTRPRLLSTVQQGRGEHNNRERRDLKGKSLRRRRRGKGVRRLRVGVLAAVSRGFASHDMLAVALAAILGHRDRACPLLEAREASPGEKREQSQNCDTRYPQAMCLTSCHRILFLLSSPSVSVNPCFFSPARGTGFFGL